MALTIEKKNYYRISAEDIYQALEARILAQFSETVTVTDIELSQDDSTYFIVSTE